MNKLVDEAPYHPGYEDAVVIERRSEPVYKGMDPTKMLWKPKPLSDAEIYACFHQYFVLGEPKPTHYELDEEDLIDFARAIEERHGIK